MKNNPHPLHQRTMTGPGFCQVLICLTLFAEILGFWCPPSALGATIVKVVADTFTVPIDTSVLGTTEDAQQVPWTGVGVGGSVPGITNNSLRFHSVSDAISGPSGGDVGLGAMQAYLAGYAVKNMRLDVKFTNNSPIGLDDKWMAVQWRKAAGNGAANDGYLFLVNRGGWWSIQTNGGIAASGFVAAWAPGVTHTLSVVATNNAHTVKYDGALLTNIVTGFNPNAGYVSLTTYHNGTNAETFDRSFDDFTLINDDIFRVDDYGFGPTWGPAIRLAVADAKAAGSGKTVLFESPGTYTMIADSDPALAGYGWFTNYAIGVLNARDLTIHANGSTLLMSNNPTRGCFYFLNCSNTVLRGITLDYDPLPFTQGLIVAKSGGTFDVRLDAGYPSLSNGWFLPYPTSFTFGMIMDPTLPLIKANVADAVFITNWTYQSGTTFRITPNYSPDLNDMVAGSDRFVYMLRRETFGAHHRFCTNSTVDSVKIYSSPSLAFALQNSTGQVYSATEVRLGPNVGSIPRLMSAGADGLHCQNNRGGPTITNCVFEGLPDDAINIYCTENHVVGLPFANQVDVSQGNSIAVLDRLQVFYPPTGLVRGESIATAVSTTNISGTNYYRVTLASSIAGLAVDDRIYNLSQCGEGYSIRNNQFLGSRRYGMKLSAGNGTAQNNSMTNMGGGGIVLRNDASVWLEGPVPGNVTILNNTLDTMQRIRALKGEGAIAAYTYRQDGGIATAGYGVTNIVFTGNKVLNSPLGMFIGAATNIVITGGTITNAPTTPIWTSTKGMLLQRAAGVSLNSIAFGDTRNDGANNYLLDGIHIMSDCAPCSQNGVTTSGLTFNLPYYGYRIFDQRSPNCLNDALVHINSIAMTWVKSGNKYKARAVVNVRDGLGTAVNGATVTGDFTWAITNLAMTGVTSSSGNATITSTSAISTGTVTFTVTGVTGAGITYSPTANLITSTNISR